MERSQERRGVLGPLVGVALPAQPTQLAHLHLPTHTPWPSMPVCVQVEREAYGRRNLKEGFRNPALIRFISGEVRWLRPAQGWHMRGRAHVA